jgi:ATP-dependent exoDNAse (exonuclease V) alpha subunit
MERNEIFETAVDFVNSTSRSIFLTGKAGTGKTTFLKYIRQHTKKKSIVVAPTGVAAINAGGVTMHSMFQLPLGPYIPVNLHTTDTSVTDKHSLFSNLRISQDKRDLICELDLLIIDEVSMVRCDALDAMDAILRFIRRKPHKVFGGVQVLFIGDLFQLPPVMPDAEWSLLRNHYESPYFFHSKAAQECQLVYLELKKIYRQNEQKFIDVLNAIRNGAPGENDFLTLNSRLNKPELSGKKYVTLTSHNYKADKINQEELRKLGGKLFECKGEIKGEFPEKNLPTEVSLQLKVGAQVMFIRNDKSNEKRYFNGKLGAISKIDSEGLYVTFPEDNSEILLEKETWENIRYSYNSSERKIDEEMLGSFSQYPIRLAWAITIHKSQGLTFENAIIDAGDSFASGQAYVALSRCTSLDGLILRSPLSAKNIITDERVHTFTNAEKSFDDLLSTLEAEKELHTNSQLLLAFEVNGLQESFEDHMKYIHHKLPENKVANAFARSVLEKVHSIGKVSAKFQLELEGLLREKQSLKIQDRVCKAMDYFENFITNEIIQLIDSHATSLKVVKGTRKYLSRVRKLRLAAVNFLFNLRGVTYGDLTFEPGVHEVPEEPAAFRRMKGKKVDTVAETFKLFEAGKTIQEIAEERGLTQSTVESHFAKLIRAGRVEVSRVLSPQKLEHILTVIDKRESHSISYLKEKLGPDYSFGEIKLVLASKKQH